MLYKYSSSKCKQRVCLHYGLYSIFKGLSYIRFSRLVATFLKNHKPGSKCAKSYGLKGFHFWRSLATFSKIKTEKKIDKNLINCKAKLCAAKL